MANNKDPINKEFFLLCLLSSGLLLLPISNQSLWIDEAWTAWFASHNSVGSLITTLKKLNTSDMQMPLYLFYIQVWVKVFGISEYALRLSNLPFGIILVTALGWISRVVLRRQYLWIGFCFSPFIWFYMNEARPYMALMAFGALTIAALLVYFADYKKYASYAPWIALSSLLIGCGFNLLAGFLVPALLVLGIFNIKDKQITIRALADDWKWPLVVELPLLITLVGFYTWTVINGIGEMTREPGLSNIAFAFYEFIGFMGLGPPRNLLRIERNFLSFIAYWPWLVFGIGAFIIIFIAAWRHINFKNHSLWAVSGSFILSLAIFFIASYIVKFQFLGRHLAVLFPLFLLVVMQSINTVSKEKQWIYFQRIVFSLLILVWGISDIRMMALPKYHKDDYLQAARLALDEARRTDGKIIWAADPIGGQYYGIQFDENNQLDLSWKIRGKGIIGKNWDKKQTINSTKNMLGKAPIILVLSKPDIYDRKKGWAYAIERLGAKCIASANAFNIYEFGGGKRG